MATSRSCTLLMRTPSMLRNCRTQQVQLLTMINLRSPRGCHRPQSTASSATRSALDEGPKSERGVTGLQQSRKQKLPPHSRLSTKMLLRSWLVSTVSSYPFLLRPALSFLLLLTKKRFAILDVNRNPILHSLMKRTFYDHFCAGENRKEVMSTIRNIKDMGFKGVILTYAREVVVDEKTAQERGLGAQSASGNTASTDFEDKEKYADIETWRNGVLDTLDMVGEGDFLALKFTGAGLAVTQALKSNQPLPSVMQEALHEICDRAAQRNVRILVDAEQQSAQPAIDRIALDLMRRYNHKESGAVIFNTYQMYLKKMVENLDRDMRSAASEGFTLGVKIVRGAYIASEPRHLIHDTKEDTDKAYDESVKAMLQCRHVRQSSSKEVKGDEALPVDIFVASHNKHSALEAVKWHEERLAQSLPTVNTIQYGQLMGMADEVSCQLLQLKDEAVSEGSSSSLKMAAPQVYKCLSWGTLDDCLSYLLRRAVENKDAVGRTVSERIATKAELLRRLRLSLGLGG